MLKQEPDISSTERAFYLAAENLPFESKLEAGEEYSLSRYNLARRVPRGGNKGPAKKGRKVLASVLDELRNQDVLPSGHLEQLIRGDYYLSDELKSLYSGSYPDGNRPLKDIVTGTLAEEFRATDTDISSLPAAVTRAFKMAFIREACLKQGLEPPASDDLEGYRTCRRGQNHPFLSDEFWRPYHSGMKSGLKLAKQLFGERRKVWVSTRSSKK